MLSTSRVPDRLYDNGSMGVGGQGMDDEYGVALFQVQLPVGFIGQRYRSSFLPDSTGVRSAVAEKVKYLVSTQLMVLFSII